MPPGIVGRFGRTGHRYGGRRRFVARHRPSGGQGNGFAGAYRRRSFERGGRRHGARLARAGISQTSGFVPELIPVRPNYERPRRKARRGEMLKKSHYIILILVVLLVLVLLQLPGATVGKLKLAISGLFLPLFGLSNSTQQWLGEAKEGLIPRRELLRQIDQA